MEVESLILVIPAVYWRRDFFRQITNYKNTIMGKRIHGENATITQVVRLHNEGWQIENIASMARVKPERVRQILKDKGILM